MSKEKRTSDIPQLVLVLVIITFATALLLGFVNQATAPIIAKNSEDNRTVAMNELIVDAEFSAVDSDGYVAEKGQPLIRNVYQATKGGEDAGYCMEVVPNGFNGAMTVVVGIDADGTVAGAKITQHAETPGLGAKAQADPTWIPQFAGKPADGTLAVTKDGGEIVSITGATITSRAVADAVNAAANYVQSLAS